MECDRCCPVSPNLITEFRGERVRRVLPLEMYGKFPASYVLWGVYHQQHRANPYVNVRDTSGDVLQWAGETATKINKNHR